jgi:hypothetical protein
MNPKKKWMGPGIEEFVAQEMKDPGFRMEVKGPGVRSCNITF